MACREREGKPKREEEKGEGWRQREKKDSISNPMNKMKEKKIEGRKKGGNIQEEQQ